MLQAMFSGVSGLQAHQVKMNVIGNNIANVNTVGFKSGRVSFQDQLSQTLSAASSPDEGSNTGGTNPSQVGLGVILGSIDTMQTQGNLQTTGRPNDLAIQGGGFFLVSNGSGVAYTRDGAFDLDSSGSLVNPANGQKLLGYPADSNGNVDTTIPITSASGIHVPIGMLTDAKQTGNINFSGNLDADSAIYSTKVDYTGNLSADTWTGEDIKYSATVYDALGNAHTVETIFKNPADNPTGAGVPTGATRAWDVVVKTDKTVTYDSAAGKSRLFQVGGTFQFADPATAALLGSSILLDDQAGANHGPDVTGLNGASDFPLSLDFDSLTGTAGASTLNGVADGQSGSSPYWGTSINIYDSLGVSHTVSFKFTHVPMDTAAPPGATGRWDWVATENGQTIGTSTDTKNSPAYFSPNGRLIGGFTNNVRITPLDGAVSPFTVSVDFSKMTQLASDATASAETQDGYPVGTLQSFAISADGIVTGVFTSGQTRSLGQVAMASFANPGGLEKIGTNMYRETNNSGTAQVGMPNRGGRGKITPGFLEMSNVDLATEFTNMIITQRGFQASTRIISVVDSLLQDVINLNR